MDLISGWPNFPRWNNMTLFSSWDVKLSFSIKIWFIIHPFSLPNSLWANRGNISGKANWTLVFSCFYCISRPTRQELLLNIDVLSITDNMASSSTQLPYNPPPANQYDTSLLILQASSKCPRKTSLCCNVKLWLEEAWKVLRLNEVVKGIVNWFIVSGGCGQKTIWQDGLLIDHFPSQIQRE